MIPLDHLRLGLAVWCEQIVRPLMVVLLLQLAFQVVVIVGTSPRAGVLLVELSALPNEDGTDFGAFRDGCVGFRIAAVVGPVRKHNASLSLPLCRGGCCKAATGARW